MPPDPRYHLERLREQREQKKRPRNNNRALLVWVSMLLLICVSVAYHMSKP